MSKHVVVLGGGLAGLSCGYELARAGARVTVLEREDQVGGMAASFVDNGTGEYWSYDFGPHRFHTNEPELIEHVKEVLGDNHHRATRLSRIVLFNRFFDYPLRAENVLRNLPPLLLVRAFVGYGWVRFTERVGLSRHSDDNFEGWVTKRFGRTLYDLFFGRYTEKAWKMPPSEISGDWASQRISLLSLGDAVRKTLSRPKAGEGPRTLVSEFLYPLTGGIGELARGYAQGIEELGGTVVIGAPAVRVLREGARVTGVRTGGPDPMTIEGDHYISTIPITALARSVRPAAPPEVLAGIANLRYISILFVYLRVNKPQVSPDSWLYLPEHHLTVHRISEFKNFSPEAAPPDKTMVCAEITCRVGDEHWRAGDDELIATAVADLGQIGLLEPNEVLDGFVKRIPYAYPVYDLDLQGEPHARPGLRPLAGEPAHGWAPGAVPLQQHGPVGGDGAKDGRGGDGGPRRRPRGGRDRQGALRLMAATAAPALVDVSSCRLCGSSRFEARFREGPREIRRCVECGLVWVSPRLDGGGAALALRRRVLLALAVAERARLRRLRRRPAALSEDVPEAVGPRAARRAAGRPGAGRGLRRGVLHAGARRARLRSSRRRGLAR